MDRRRAGALASVVLLPVQLLVAWRWSEGYSVTRNAISDLGVTGCGVFSEQGQQVREVCSPWHLAFNAGVVASGALVVIGAVLLHGRWDSRSGRAGTALMTVWTALVGATLLRGRGPHEDAARAAARVSLLTGES